MTLAASASQEWAYELAKFKGVQEVHEAKWKTAKECAEFQGLASVSEIAKLRDSAWKLEGWGGVE